VRCHQCGKPARIRLVAHCEDAQLSVPSCFACRAELTGRVAHFRWQGKGTGFVSERYIGLDCGTCIARGQRYASWRTDIDEADNVNCADCGVTLRVIDG
jgi:hypothetical protein